MRDIFAINLLVKTTQDRVEIITKVLIGTLIELEHMQPLEDFVNGVWEYHLDQEWVIAVNPHDRDIRHCGILVRAKGYYFEFRGFPLAVIHYRDTLLHSSIDVHYDSLVKALVGRIEFLVYGKDC